MERQWISMESEKKDNETLAVKELVMKLKPNSSVMKDWPRPGISG